MYSLTNKYGMIASSVMENIVRDPEFPYLPKDFVRTEEGLIFAVISYHPHEGRVGSFLRYVEDEGQLQKVDTTQANRLLSRYYPGYLYHSPQFDAAFHAVPVVSVNTHHRPEQALIHKLSQTPGDIIEQRFHQLIAILESHGANRESLGLTGSMLIDRHGPGSDIDLVVYGRHAFHQARQAVQAALAAGELSALDETLMQANYHRRGSELNYEDFAWHERRKFNKAAIDGTKFDLGMVCLPEESDVDHRRFRKQGMRTIRARVVDDSRAFDFPAHYLTDNPLTPEVIAFTHTYVGQAQAGEMIEVCGAAECDPAGHCRIVVGSSREATGEYIKVSELS